MTRLGVHNAVVTGAGSGIGKAIAVRLAAEGAKVLVNDLDANAARATADMITSNGGTAIARQGDVSDPDHVDRMFKVCEHKWDVCTLLVNSAGIVQQARFADLTVEDWDRMIAVHLRGTFLGCRRAIRPMLERGDGVIINIASQLGQIGGVELTHYSAAKAGIIGLTKALAREISTRGVRINAVAPGPINNELVMALSD
ncbi:MAG: SDR family NAD(P)-dependent oxidoreductase, partial [Geminicoccaceae bacterium]